ncbi:MAG: hypothetical protein RIE06_05430 [Roseibium album]|uniref:hypothetical protein n=1 Tax=Roseibium album TaxID=311410 RepID=UPI0032EE23CD
MFGFSKKIKTGAYTGRVQKLLMDNYQYEENEAINATNHGMAAINFGMQNKTPEVQIAAFIHQHGALTNLRMIQQLLVAYLVNEKGFPSEAAAQRMVVQQEALIARTMNSNAPISDVGDQLARLYQTEFD